MSEQILDRERERIVGLCNDDQRLLGYAPSSETDDGVYYVTVREQDHRDVDGAKILSLHYAYLTRGGGSDGWVDDGGTTFRVEGDLEEFMGDFAQLLAASKARVGGGVQPARRDLRAEE